MQRKLFVLFAGLVLLSLMIAPVGMAGAQGLALLAHHAVPICSDPLGCVTIAPSDPIHIAYALVTAGPNADLGIDERNGIEIAIDDSVGQILGHNIQFDGQDSGCSSEGGLAAGTVLAADSSIVAVIGTSCSIAARAAMPLLSAAGFVMVSPSNTGTDLTELGNPNNHPGYLRTSWSDKVQGTTTAQFAWEYLGITTAATIRDGNWYADYLQQAFADEFTNLGGTITAQKIIDPGQTDMSTVLTSIAADTPALLYFPVFIPAGGYIINQARHTAGLESAYLMGADALYTQDVVTATGVDVEGFMVTSLDFTKFSAEYYDSFLPAYRAKFGTDPISIYHAHAYDAFMLIKAAIQQVAVVDPDGTIQIGRQALRDAMYGTQNFPGLTGNLTCSATGDCADPHIAVYEYHTGQFPPEYIWSQISDTIGTGGGSLTSYHGDTTIQIPAGAITDTIIITYTPYGMPPGGNLTGIGHVFDVTAVYSSTGQPAQIASGHTYTVTVQYTDAEKGPAIENTLALYYWDGSQWVKESSSVVDTIANKVTATPNHFSLWAVLDETRRVYLPLIIR